MNYLKSGLLLQRKLSILGLIQRLHTIHKQRQAAYGWEHCSTRQKNDLSLIKGNSNSIWAVSIWIPIVNANTQYIG